MATSISRQTLSYVRADLAAALNPVVTTTSQIDDPETPPNPAAGGVSVLGSLVVEIDVAIAEDPWRRRTRVSITTYDNAADYTYNQNGTAVVHSAAAATLPVMLAAWAAAINASAIDATAQAIDTDGDGDADQLLVTQDANLFEYVVVSATGSAALAATADATTAVADVYAVVTDGNEIENTAESQQRHGWRRYTLPDGTTLGSIAVDSGGLTLALPCSVYERVAVVLSDVDGPASDSGVTYAPRTWIRPCQQTGTTGA